MPRPLRTRRSAEPRTARTPGQLFADYCAEREISDPRVADLFGQLHDEVTATDGDPDGTADAAELSSAN